MLYRAAVVRLRAALGAGRILAGCLAAGAFAAQAFAQPAKGLELRWSAPPGCPAEAEVLRAVDQLLGSAAVPLAAEARVERREDGFHLSLSWRTATAAATRELEGESCQQLAQAAALMVALAAGPLASDEDGPGAGVTPDANAERPVSQAAPAASTERPASRPQASTQARAPIAPTPIDTLIVSARVGASVDTGSLPSPSVGVLGGARFAQGANSLVVNAVVLAPKEAEKPFGGGRFWLGVVSLEPCHAFSLGRLTLTPCAAAEVHMMPSRGLGLDSSEESVALFLRVGAGAMLGVNLVRDLRVFIDGFGLWAPSRPTFVVERDPVFRPGAFSGRAAIGFEHEF
jgi:hypothetical protein